MLLENNRLILKFDEKNGSIISFYDKQSGSDMINEKRLADNFRLLVPVPDYQCNYIDGMKQKNIKVKSLDNNAVIVSIDGMEAEKGRLDIKLEYTVKLEDSQVIFKSKLENNTPFEISEFWFPRLGGWNSLFGEKNAKLAVPGYLSCKHDRQIFKSFPGCKRLGSEGAEYDNDYPSIMMPWWDLYDESKNRGLMLTYLDTIFRYSTWHTYLFPNVSGRVKSNWMDIDEAMNIPVGMVFSHVRYPFIKNQESFESGEFIFKFHDGDWHQGSMFYREWFMKNFPFDKKDSWLRKKSSWFTSIIHQPEDRIVTDYEGYDKWCIDAESYGVNCHELIGWDKGGLERDYPEYIPEKKIGGKEGFRRLLKSINDRGSKCLVFINYNILDSATNLYKNRLKHFTHQDPNGSTPNWMCWGESTLLARKGISTRRHVLASVTQEFEKIIEDYLLEIVRDGAHGFQIDKLCVGSTLDFNPLNRQKPDVALCEGLISAIKKLYNKCCEINPDFRIAAEAVQDRLLPYVDVFYRNSHGTEISPLRYVFPEWTSCLHLSSPLNYNIINSSVMTGSVLCIEPECYMGTMSTSFWNKTSKYISEIERIRKDLLDVIFIGKYYDNTEAYVSPETVDTYGDNENREEDIGNEVMIPGGGASISFSSKQGLFYKLHGSNDDKRRAIVVINTTSSTIKYNWAFKKRSSKRLLLYRPFEKPTEIKNGKMLEIPGEGIHIIVDEIKNMN